MSDAVVTYESRHGNAVITLCHERARNALSPEMLRQLDAMLDQAIADPAVQGVILTGAGTAAFSAGADIAYLSTATASQVRDYARTAIRLTEKIEAMDKIVVAAINGNALGGGLEIAESCTFRLAVHDARLGHPEVRIGAVAGFGGTTRLPRLIGRSMATELLLTGDTVSAEQALSLGLIHRVTTHATLLQKAESILARVAQGAPHAVRLTRDAMHRGLDMSIGAALRLGADHFGLAASEPDFREGTTAFLEKRAPKWKADGSAARDHEKRTMGVE